MKRNLNWTLDLTQLKQNYSIAILVSRFSLKNLAGLARELFITSFKRLKAGNRNHSPILSHLLDRFYVKNIVVLDK